MSLLKRILPGLKKEIQTINTFKDYQSALAMCKSGYDDEEIAQLVAQKTQIFRDMTITEPLSRKQDIQNLFTFSKIINISPEIKLKVLEFGGGCGADFYLLNNDLASNIEQWEIVETNTMVKYGHKINTSSKLSFHNLDVLTSSSKNHNVAFLQGVLQYLPDPERILIHILETGYEFIYLSRLPLLKNSKQSIITLQKTELSSHGPGYIENIPSRTKVVPLTYLSDNVLFSSLKKNNYTEILVFSEEPEYSLTHDNQTETIKTIGLLLKKN